MKQLLLASLFVLLPVLAWAGADTYQYSGVKTSDASIKTGSGFFHAITCGSDAAATAGTLSIRDSLTAGTGTIIATFEFAAAYYPPSTQIFNVAFGTGLYLDFTTTADVSCTVSFK